MFEDTIKELMSIDPKNFFVKYEYTKNLIEKNEIWKALIEFLRTKSLCEEKLKSDPENFRLLNLMSELE